MESLGLEFDFTGLGRNVLPWIVLLPLAGAAINGLFGRNAPKGTVTAVAIGSVFMAFVSAVIAFGDLLGAGEEGPQEIVNTVYEWFTISIPGGTGTFHVPVNVRFVMDHLSGIMTVMVTGIATLIHVYSASYMGDDPGYRRFMTYLNLFTASMLILVLASNIPLMFVGWEGVGLCSYLLIGFWWENPAYAAAGRKAFVVNRIGDFGVLIGTFLIVATTHTFEFDADQHGAAEDLWPTALRFGIGRGPSLGINVSSRPVACLFSSSGCTGKSAQLPLYVWLPDAMAGPTPVSALIHAATMVTAGVYLMRAPVAASSSTASCDVGDRDGGRADGAFAASIALVQTK
jgi:NADH-quinone oxidoreductase subunit L